MKIDTVHKDIKEFILGLDTISKSEVLKVVDLLGEVGHDIRMPFSKKIAKNLYELRINSIQNVRIFYTFYKDQIFLLHAITKKTQKLPKRDFATAINRLKWLH